MKNEKIRLTPEKAELSISKRDAESSDFQFAQKAHHSAYHDVVVRQFGVWDEKTQDDFFQKEWAESKNQMILCNGEACGYCSIETKDNIVYIQELVLLPNFQGKGIGTKILKETIESAQTSNLPVRLNVLKQNQAIELYHKLGFTKIGENDTHYELEYVPHQDKKTR